MPSIAAPPPVLFAAGTDAWPGDDRSRQLSVIADELARRATPVHWCGPAEQERGVAELLDRVGPGLLVIDADTAAFRTAAVARARSIPFVLATSRPASTVFSHLLPRRARPATRAVSPKPRHYAEAAAAVLGFSVFGLEYAFPAPAHLHMVGPMRPERSGTERHGLATRRWLAEHDSVVYAALGAQTPLTAEHVSALFAAFARLRPPHHALWRLTRAQRELLPPRHAWPDQLRIEDADPEDPADAEVLAHPHVRAFVTHGAHDCFHEAVYFGKPLLVLPLHADSPEFGARAIASGVGLAVRDAPGFGVHDVLPGLLRLLGDRRFDEEASRWSRRLRKAGGVRRAAGLILDELGRSADADARR